MKTFSSRPFELLASLIFVALLIAIVLKAIWVPITHDELSTAILYGKKFTVWELMMYPDSWPNNHILNSICTKFFIVIFGSEQWAIRLPNVLSFLVYFWGAWKIAKITFGSDKIWFIVGIVLFINNPFLLDFFGLCRGYGMASAFCLLSLSFLVEGYSHNKTSAVWIALILAMFASYASFTLLFFWLSTCALAFLYFTILAADKTFKQVFGRLAVLGTTMLVYGKLVSIPIQKMRANNEFMYWEINSFFDDTILSVTENWRYGAALFIRFNYEILAYIVVAIFVIAIAYLIFKLIRTRAVKEIMSSPLFVCTLVLALVVILDLCKTHFLNTPYLTGRTALFYYPLFVSVVVCLAGKLPFTQMNKNYLGWILATLIIAFGGKHLREDYKFSYVNPWFYDKDTFKVQNILKKEFKGEKVTLATHWMFNPSFYFYATTGKTPWLKLHPYNKEYNVNTSAEYYYIFASEYHLFEGKFEKVELFDSGGLLIKKMQKE